ncbi:DUF3466 family protein [Pseudoalteromonas 'SMAR']|uniref:DUF3466 family protein n=1 Tax=Pseudoalteromonas 'SMAR' TaxID=3416908 RepID=UPI003AF2F64D
MKFKLLAASVAVALSQQAAAATYQLTELPRHDNSKYSYITDANEAGDIIGHASNLFGVKIDVSYIDFEDSTIQSEYDTYESRLEAIDEEITFTLDDIENNNAANTNAQAHTFMLLYLSNRGNSLQFQKVIRTVSLSFTNNSAEEFVVFDKQSPDFEGLTRSVVNYLTSVSEDGVISAWGSAPYEKITFTPEGETEEETYFVRDWRERGVVISPSNQRVELEPEFSQYGGTSKATDISQLADGGYVVVGQSSIGLAQTSQEAIEDNCDGVDEPMEVCVKLLGNIYHQRAYQWTLDSDFTIIDTQDLGLAFTPDDDDERAYSSIAMAVNNSGMAVGYSRARRQSDDELLLYEQAVIYQNGEHKRIKEVEYYSEYSKAIDVNDNGIVVGVVGRKGRTSNFDTTGFYYDTQTDTYNTIPSYFEGAEVDITDINNNGFVIGQAEVEKSGSNRRREAFIYEIGAEAAINLNTLLPCRSDDFPYTIAEAVKITDDNKVYAIATKTVERRNSLGEVEKDSNGEIEYESVTLPVLLTPISGEVEDCTPPEAETYERNSASWSWLSLLALPLVMLRRRRK